MTMMRPWMSAWLAACVMLPLSMPVYAGKMYRCGSGYQDRPCGGGQDGKVLGSHGAPVSAPAPASAASTAPVATVAVTPTCRKRGGDAQRIKWIREAGRTEEEQLAKARSPEERELIVDVYRRSGTSGDVRAAIEAECMAQHDREAQARALEQAASRLRGGN